MTGGNSGMWRVLIRGASVFWRMQEGGLKAVWAGGGLETVWVEVP